MDPQTDLPDLVEDLEVNIDELTTALTPLLAAPLSTTASSLPLLDKAKLYVLAAYAAESLLFSSLQASGANAKEHAVFKELGRLKGYYGKIKSVEEPPSQPKAKLDVGAAARFIRHGLAGNDRYHLERAERVAKERARAHLKAQQINKKFSDDGGEMATDATPTPKKRDAGDMQAEEPQRSYDDGDEGLEASQSEADADQPAPKRQRLSVAAQPMDPDSAPDAKHKKKRKKRGKKKTKSTELSDQDPDDSNSHPEPEPEPEFTLPTKPNTSRKTRSAAADDEETCPLPRTRSATSNAPEHAEDTPKPKRGRGRPPKAKK